MKVKAIFLILHSIAIGLIIGFSTSSTASPLHLEKSLIESHKSDLLGLYNSWIKPLKKNEEGYFECESKHACANAFEDIQDGFTRFCSGSGGLISSSPNDSSWECLVNATFIGGMGVNNYGNTFSVWYETVESRAMEKAAVLELATRKTLNGPSGLITTENGDVFRFLRFGTLSTRIAVEIDLTYGNQTKVKEEIATIENLSRIDFLPTTPKHFYEMTVHLKDGRIMTVPTTAVYERVTRGYLIHFNQWPLVVVDTMNGKLQEDKVHRISSIEFDPENEWQGKTIKEMEQSAFYYALSKADSSIELEKFIKNYKDNDPDGLLLKVKQKLPAIKAQEEKLALEKAERDAEFNRQEEIKQKEIAKNNEKLHKTINLFRRTVKVGDDSHCGLVVEVKPPLIKIQSMVGEVWLKISQIYPTGITSCHFLNNVYQEPSNAPF